MNEYIKADDVVLELGARYGTVSCRINDKLNNRCNQVSVEPDERVWNALEQNKKNNNCKFHILKGFICSKKLNLYNTHTGGGSTFIEDNNSNIQSFTMENVENKYNLKFNVLVADCEGFLETFFDENPQFYKNSRLIIYEMDYREKCNYQKIRDELFRNGFRLIKRYKQKHCAWIKK